MKKKFIVLVVVMLIISSSVASFANNKNSSQKKIEVVNIDSDDVEVSGVLSFDEITTQFAKDKKISKSEAKEIFVKNKINNSKLRNSSMTIDSIKNRSTWRTISNRFTVRQRYKPDIRFYCETSEGGTQWGIKEIIDVQIDQEYNGTVKKYDGNVFTHLQDAGTIKYTINTHFYDKGMTTGGLDVGIGIGQYANASFNISYEGNHYGYCYKELLYEIR